MFHEPSKRGWSLKKKKNTENAHQPYRCFLEWLMRCVVIILFIIVDY